MTEDEDLVLLDSERANIRKTGGVYVQRIPKRWRLRRDLKNFFEGDLEIALIRQNDQRMILIRRAPKETANETEY